MAIASKLIVLCLLAPMVGRAAPLTLSTDVRIEPVTAFTVKELWSATTPVHVDIGDVVADYRMIDAEVPIFSGKWRQCGLVMVGSGDLAVSPVAFRIWTKRECSLTTREPRKLKTGHEVQLDLLVNPAVSVPLRISNELVVTVGMFRIGQIRSD
jgi:hypothetical protein